MLYSGGKNQHLFFLSFQIRKAFGRFVGGFSHSVFSDQPFGLFDLDLFNKEGLQQRSKSQVGDQVPIDEKSSLSWTVNDIYCHLSTKGKDICPTLPSHYSTFRLDSFIIHTTSHLQITTDESCMKEVGICMKDVEQSRY